MVTVKRFEIGDYFTNSYLVIEEDDSILIDVGGDPSEILEYVRTNNINLKAILATHGHFDHVIGVPLIQRHFKVPFYMNRKDEIILRYDSRTREINVDGDLKEGVINFGKILVKVIETPGHTLGSVSFMIEDNLFTGDTLFNENIGRYDLGGDREYLKKSLRRLMDLEDLLNVYPGHGFITTLGYEKLNNPFLNGEIDW
ncbi:MBL fold metallo-hydrolase [Sulfolobus acidocaldarius]|uniref:Conserved protein n=4 Tax=Sulfolobus acidocaldarius TaxID=2285 RepID=Q4JCD2_SULAC|nr:MBL fold metallo-hydrolase [Sulfolobus acidocaldarius]AAY79547.1 conserved protein [Sulfolobus acidocaldarius DSM 639]AGE70098.1 hypothetical protein SacN8_00585 [Sulfolobus acidocaldarius N8]AGE72373.1 hypothetical protein SacRon12I_00585 [Sulfolobus acidocaldarius Ron12/I]ALU29483.1 MBL fold metallo-hydrolase [Sulfolobus acidocaldarius]ALU32211.1 MBL fold metallo-hydrolase [Sulfolobus acidocaldarius]